jgi:hypothetical protein
LKGALRNKRKIAWQDFLNSELYKYSGDSLCERLLHFNNIYMMLEMLEEGEKKYCRAYIQDRRQTNVGKLRRN